MQKADLASPQPLTPCPGPGWNWSPRFSRWLEPGASPISGYRLPPEHRFKPGESGRQSKGGIISQAVRDVLEENRDRVRAIALKWIESCEAGDNKARDQLLDRLEGRVEQ